MWDFLFGKNKDQYDAEYDKAIKDTKQQRADAEYNYRYNKALYDANKDYFDKVGVKDPSASYWNDNGQRTNALTETMNQYNKYLSDLSKEREDVARANKYNVFGDGIIGGLLNPFNQAGTAVQDFVTSGTREWDKGNRDVLSDLGAIGESALTVAPFAGLGLKALKGGATVAKAANTASKMGKIGQAVGNFATSHPLLSKIGKSALGMGGWSGLGALTDYGSNIGEHLPETALRVGAGMAMGGAYGGVGYGLGKVGDKLANIAKNNRTTATTENVVTNLYDDMGNAVAKNGVSYQDALKTAGLDNATDKHFLGRIMSGAEISPEDLTPEVMDRLANKLNIFTETLGGEKAPKTAVVGNEIFSPKQQLQKALYRLKTIPYEVTTTPVTTYTVNGLSNRRLGQIGQGIGDLIKDLPNTTKKGMSKVSNSKVGTNIANLLKTKKGKVLLGGSAGLTLAGLMKANNSNSNNLSDAEMQELYNYIYRGGQ